ncbi:hypothetical protein ACHQM5_021743 [Ranunculus cassubicifolius]
MVLPCLPTISHLVTASLPALKASLSSVGLAMVKAMTDVDEKLKILERQLLRVEAFISEAEECQISDQALQVLVRDAEQLAYDAADFLDAIAIKVSYLDGGNQGYKEDVFRMLLSLLKRSSSSQLNTIKDRLDYIQLEVDRFPSAELVDGRHKSAIQSKLPTSSLLDDVHSVVGRDSDVDSLIQMIRVHYRETNSNSISVIPIVDGKYTMHDAVHSFAQSVSGEKFFRMEEDDELQISCIHKNTRHSSLLVENVERKTFESFYMCKGRLSNLRHLDLGRNHELASMTSGIGRLTGLQTLNEFIVHQRKGKISELKNLNSIRGSLCIKKLENVKHPEEALEARLARKKHLQRLELHWTSVTSESNDEHVLENLLTTPHDSLRELFLKGYGGSHLSNVGNPLFSKLASISFDNFRNCIRLPMLGQLPKLKSLLIKEVNMLTLIDETFLGDVPGFPFLETLEFCNMLKLEHWAGLRADDLPCLRELTIINCPELVTLPSFEYLRSLQKLELEKCHKLHSLPGERLSDAVQSLIITECPILEEKYRRDGEHWMTIMHIPHIQIGDDYHHQGINFY